MKISLSKEDSEILREFGETNFPNEACALLFGKKNTGIQVFQVVATENQDRSPVSFSIDPELIYKAVMKWEDEGKELVGIFHTHPRSAYPSSKDLKFMPFWPVCWLIGVTIPEKPFILRGFVLENSHVVELEIEITP